MRYRVRRDTPEAKTDRPTEPARFRSGMRAAKCAGERAARDRAVYVVEAVDGETTVAIVHTAWPSGAGGHGGDAASGVRQPQSPRPAAPSAQAAADEPSR